jgi:hypothetical protein
MKTIIPQFADRAELFQYLMENKAMLIADKKSERKFSDGIDICYQFLDIRSNSYKTIKANNPVNVENINELKVKVIINTTNILDSHSDVHIPGLWKKSLSENKNIKFLQEHEMYFKSIIADRADLKAYTQDYTWKELGYPKFKGTTQALVFEAVIKRSRNSFMFDQYAAGYVDNHSVGMNYVTLVLCINDEDPYYGAEFEAYQKYIEQVVNKEDAEKQGYFWAVKEAKVSEGSAVVLGSNYVTPTVDNNMKRSRETTSSNNEPLHSNKGAANTLTKYANYLAENFSIN